MTQQSPITTLFTGAPASADKFTPGISTVALVRLPGRTILFDTGPYAYRPILLGRLKRIGVELDAIDTVVLSHCHWDTAGNADLFPNAQVILHERELAYAQNAARLCGMAPVNDLHPRPCDHRQSLDGDAIMRELHNGAAGRDSRFLAIIKWVASLFFLFKHQSSSARPFKGMINVRH